MKKSKTFLPVLGARAVSRLASAAWCLLAIAACGTDDESPAPAGEDAGRTELRFATEVADPVDALTRSGELPEKQVAVIRSEEADNPVYLHVYEVDGIRPGKKSPVTRAGGADDIIGGNYVTTESFYPDFGVYGYLYDGVFNDSAKPDFINNATVTRQNDGSYCFRQPYYLPAEGDGRTMRFFAYAPCTGYGVDTYFNSGGKLWTDTFIGEGPWNTQSNGLHRFFYPSFDEISGRPKFYYRIFAAPESQFDFCFASIVINSNNRPEDGKITLTFHHAMAAIEFYADASISGKTVYNIEIRGMKTSGYCIPESPPGSGVTWTYGDQSEGGGGYNGAAQLAFRSNAIGSYTYRPVKIGSTGRTKISGEGHTFFTIPHPYLAQGYLKPVNDGGSATTGNVTVTVFWQGADDYNNTSQFKLTGSWEAGKTYRYVLSKQN